MKNIDLKQIHLIEQTLDQTGLVTELMKDNNEEYKGKAVCSRIRVSTVHTTEVSEEQGERDRKPYLKR